MAENQWQVWLEPVNPECWLYKRPRLIGEYDNKDDADECAYLENCDEPAPDKNDYRRIKVREPMSNDPLKAALSAFLATQAIKLVHVWNVGESVNAMMEWPYDPTRKKPLPTEKHTTGSGTDAVAAVIKGLDNLGHNGLAFRLFLLSYMIELNGRSR